MTDTETTNDRTDEPEERPASHAWLVWGLIVVASLIAIASALNVWVQRQLLDTDEWVAVSDELLEDDEIRAALSAFLVDELYDSVDVSAELEEKLPEDWKGLAGPVSAALRGPATDGVDSLLNTSAARATWSEVNRTAHAALVAILKDEVGDSISTADGTVTLDLGELVRKLGEQLGLSSDLLDKIPQDAGQIVIAQSDQLAAAQRAVAVIEFLSVFLFVLVVGLYAGAVYAAKDRRRETLRNVGIAVALSGLVVLVLQRISISLLIDAFADAPNSGETVGRATAVGTALLRDIAMTGLAMGLLIAFYAALSGPSRVALRCRKAIAPVLNAGPLAVWSSAAVVFLILTYLVPGTAADRWIPALVTIGLFVTGVEMLRRQVAEEHPDASLSESWENLRQRLLSLRSGSGAKKGVDEVERLHRLHQDGVLTDEEFDQAKQHALSHA